MSREIDERIVAMYFDNRNFESGAQQTLKTLEQLKQGCNMEGVGKGFEALEDVSKRLKLDKVVQGANKVKSSFAEVGTAIKKAFSINPIEDMMGKLNNFRFNFLDKIIGFDLAGRLASSLENVFRSLTIAPISAGWKQYENTMDSVKTIMSSTGESIDVVKNKLGEMTDYANLTIYSLNDMTSNLGKFTNNGVKLDDATNAMIGLANATADAGQGAAQASMAMYNVSQAIGVGKMTTIDWKSLENANIATQKLKRTFIQSAVASGQLEKKIVQVKDATTGLTKEEVQYWTKAEKGSQAEQVTVENFRDTLNKGWLTKEAMLKTFAIYSGQMDIDSIAAMGFDKQQAEELYEIGQKALEAAQEVRTFSKMMDALKESVQSTWATSFEYIFGDMEEGTNLWTMINDKIDDVLTKGAEARNNILMSWRGMMKDENGQVRKIEEVYRQRKDAIDYNYRIGLIDRETWDEQMGELESSLGNRDLWVDYREIAIESLTDVMDIIKYIAGQIKEAWNGVFGTFNADSLKGITSGIKGVIDNIKTWLGDLGNADSNINKIRNAFTGVFTVLKAVFAYYKTKVQVILALATPIFQTLLDLLSAIGAWMGDIGKAKNIGDAFVIIGDKFKALWKTLSSLGFGGVLEKIWEGIQTFFGNIAGSLGSFLGSIGLGGVADFFVSVGDTLKAGWETVSTKITEWWNAEGGPGEFFRGIWQAIIGNFQAGENGEASPFAQFFIDVGDWFKEAWESASATISGWWNAEGGPGEFFTNLWNSVVGNFQAGENGEASPFAQFFIDVGDWFKEAWENGAETITNWWNAEGGPGEFFSNLWDSIIGNFTPGLGGEASPIGQFFINVGDWFKEAWENGSKTVTDWWNAEGGPSDFFTNLWDSVVGNFTEGEEGQASPFAQFFIDVGDWFKDAWNSGSSVISEWWNQEGGPSEFFTNLWDSIVGNFESPGEGVPSAFEQFFIDIGDWFAAAWASTSATIVGWWTAPEGPGEFFDDLWQSIVGNFVAPPEGGPSAFEQFFINVGDWLKEAWNTVSTSITTWWTAPDGPGEFFDGVWASIVGNFEAGPNGESSPFVKFFEDLWVDIQDIWAEIVRWPGWQEIGNFFVNTWDWIVGQVNPGTAGKGTNFFSRTWNTIFSDTKVGMEAFDSVPVDEGSAEAAEKKLGIIGQIIAALGEFVESIKSWSEDMGFGDIGLRFIDSVGKLLESVALIAEHLVNLVHNIATGTNPLGSWAEVLGIIATILTFNIFKTRNLTSLGKISEQADNITSVGTNMLQIAGAIALLALAMSVLGKLDPNEMLQAAGMIAVLGAALFAVIMAINKLKESINAGKPQPETSKERIIKHLITSVTIAGSLAEVMALLPNILDKLKGFNSDINGDAIFKTFSGLAVMIGSLIVSIGVFNKLGGSDMSISAAAQGALSIVVGLGILLVGMDAIIGSLFGLGEELKNWDAKFFGGITEAHVRRIQAGGKILVALGEAIGGFLGALGGGLAGGFTRSQNNELAYGTEEAANILKNVSVEDMEHMADVVGVLSDIQESLPDFDSIWDKWINGDKLGLLGDNVGRLGEGLGRMVTAINPADLDTTNDIARLKGYIDLLGGFGSVMQILYNSVEQANALFGTSYIGPEVIGSMMNSVLPFYRDAARLLGEAVQEGLGEEGSEALASFNFDPTGIIAAICRSLEQQGSTEVAQAVRAMIQAGLNSYGDSSSLGEGGLHSTDQINQGLTKIFEMMTNNGASLNLESVLTSFLGGLGEEGKVNELVSRFSGNFSALGGAISEKLNENITLDFSKWTATDEEGNLLLMKDLNEQLEQVMSQFGEEGGEIELHIRPVIDINSFGGEMMKLRGAFSSEMPLAMKATIDMGNQDLPINDTNIIAEIRAVRNDLNTASATLQRVLYAVDSSLGGKINGVTSAVSRLKLTVNTGPTLKQIDEGLGRSSKNSELTGVTGNYDYVYGP